MANAFLFLMIYSFLGWLCESIYISIGRKQWINSGFLHGPFCPIYGFGSIFVIYLLTPFLSHPLLVFILGILITSTLEYFTSWLLEYLFHIMWWDYSHYKYHINGRVCLLNSFLFGLMSIFVLYFLHPTISHFTSNLTLHSIYFIDLILLLYLITDLIFSTIRLIDFKQEYSEFISAIEELKNELTVQFEESELIEKIESHKEQVKNKIHELQTNFETKYKKKHYHRAFPNIKLTKRKDHF